MVSPKEEKTVGKVNVETSVRRRRSEQQTGCCTKRSTQVLHNTEQIFKSHGTTEYIARKKLIVLALKQELLI